MALQSALLKSEISRNFNKEQQQAIEHRCGSLSRNKDVNMNEIMETDTACTERSESLVKKLVADFESKQKQKEEEQFLTKNRAKLEKQNRAKSNIVSCRTIRCNLEQKKDDTDKENPISDLHHYQNIVDQRTSVIDARENQRASFCEVHEKNDEINVNKKKSFRDMLNLMIGQKKHDDKSQRIRSCDELKRSEERHIYIPRVRSHQIENKEVPQVINRYATIKPIYGGRRYSKVILSKSIESFTSRTLAVRGDSGYGSSLFSVEESTQNLVKPSTIRNITERFSQHSGQTWNGKSNESGDLIYDSPTKRSKDKASTCIRSDNQYENVHAILPGVTKSTKEEFLKRRERKARAYKEYCKGFLPSSREKGRIRRRWMLGPFDECINS